MSRSDASDAEVERAKRVLRRAGYDVPDNAMSEEDRAARKWFEDLDSALARKIGWRRCEAGWWKLTLGPEDIALGYRQVRFELHHEARPLPQVSSLGRYGSLFPCGFPSVETERVASSLSGAVYRVLGGRWTNDLPLYGWYPGTACYVSCSEKLLLDSFDDVGAMTAGGGAPTLDNNSAARTPAILVPCARALLTGDHDWIEDPRVDGQRECASCHMIVGPSSYSPHEIGPG